LHHGLTLHHSRFRVHVSPGLINPGLQELEGPFGACGRDKLPKKLYHLVKELFVFHWKSFMVKVWNVLSTCALVVGVTSLVPVNLQGGLMFPLWVCLFLIAVSAVLEFLLFVHRRAK
jgi:hypothetical protein